MKINQLDLFSGVGGFHLGFEKAGYKVNSFFSEIDKHSIAVYKNKFKNSKYVGAVQNVRESELPKIDLITFGSPCQDFSLAGKREGMGGKKSSLILEAIRLIGECRPRVFIWENVKGTFSSNSGEDFASILQSFANIGGYRLEWQLLNTSWFPRTPQNRERIYLVGYSTKTKRSWRGIFPIGAEGEYPKSSQPTQGDKAIIPNDNGQIQVADYRNDEGLRIRLNGDSPTLSARRRSSTDISTMPPLIIKANTKKGYEAANYGDSVNYSVPTSKTRRGRVGKGVAQTLDTAVNQGVVEPKIVSYTRDAKGKVTNRNLKDEANTIHSSVGGGGSTDQFVQDYRVRRLTPIECERLQGFPDNHTEYGDYDGEIIKVSNTQRYKQCGNAVTVDVVQAVAEKCKPLFK
tara:strand:- start:10 stop:1218 length:1209 start_codon:yes stop_codon:yes gene_type:complete